MIRSVVQGVECYWLSILPITCGAIDKIYAVCRSFMWTSKHHPISWNTVCSPIEDGGMGIRDLRAWNKALLMKTLWNIHMKKDTLWVKWVNHYYWDDITKWRWRKDDTILIKKLIEIRDELVGREGSWGEAVEKMGRWFGEKKGLYEAYKSFNLGAGRWP